MNPQAELREFKPLTHPCRADGLGCQWAGPLSFGWAELKARRGASTSSNAVRLTIG